MEEKTLNEKMREQFEMLVEKSKSTDDAFDLAELSKAMVEVYKVLRVCEKQDKLEAELKEMFSENLKDLGNTLMGGSRSNKPVS